MSAGCDAWVEIGRRIRTLRIMLELTQTELAKRCFVTQQAVSLWERGEAMPTRPTQFTVADILRQPRSGLFREIAESEAA